MIVIIQSTDCNYLADGNFEVTFTDFNGVKETIYSQELYGLVRVTKVIIFTFLSPNYSRHLCCYVGGDDIPQELKDAKTVYDLTRDELALLENCSLVKITY